MYMNVHTHTCSSIRIQHITKHASLTLFVSQQHQNLGRRFGTSKMHLSPQVALAAVRSKAVVLLLIRY